MASATGLRKDGEVRGLSVARESDYARTRDGANHSIRADGADTLISSIGNIQRPLRVKHHAGRGAEVGLHSGPPSPENPCMPVPAKTVV